LRHQRDSSDTLGIQIRVSRYFWRSFLAEISEILDMHVYDWSHYNTCSGY
jgi:hypothetical protein